MSDETYKSNCAFDLGDGAAPAGVSPDVKAFEQAPPGTWLMQVTDFEVAGLDANGAGCKEYKWKGQSCWSAQLRPKLAIVGGPHDGATAMDFLPMPYKGCTLLTEVANQWVNFLQALGFELPKAIDAATGKPRVTSLVPPGFKLQDIIGKRVQVKIVQQTDQNNAPKLNRQGEPMTEPCFFGYSRPTNGAPPATNSPKPAATTAPTPVAASRPAPLPSEPAVPVGAAAAFDDL